MTQTPPGTPHYVFMHHPVLDDPIMSRTQIPKLYLNQADAHVLLRLGKVYNLKAVFTGHIHRNSVLTQGNLTQISIASVSKEYPNYARTQYLHDTYGPNYVWYKYLSWLNTIGQPSCFSFINIDQEDVRVMWHYVSTE